MIARTLLLVAAVALLSGCQMPAWTSLESPHLGDHRAAMNDHYKIGTAGERFHSW